MSRLEAYRSDVTSTSAARGAGPLGASGVGESRRSAVGRWAGRMRGRERFCGMYCGYVASAWGWVVSPHNCGGEAGISALSLASLLTAAYIGLLVGHAHSLGVRLHRLDHCVPKPLGGLPDVPSFKKPRALLPEPPRSRKVHLDPLAGVDVSAQRLQPVCLRVFTESRRALPK